MTITELIKRFEYIKEKYGDIDVLAERILFPAEDYEYSEFTDDDFNYHFSMGTFKNKNGVKLKKLVVNDR